MYDLNLKRFLFGGLAIAASFATAHPAGIEARQVVTPVSTNPMCFNTW